MVTGLSTVVTLVVSTQPGPVDFEEQETRLPDLRDPRVVRDVLEVQPSRARRHVQATDSTRHSPR